MPGPPTSSRAFPWLAPTGSNTRIVWNPASTVCKNAPKHLRRQLVRSAKTQTISRFLPKKKKYPSLCSKKTWVKPVSPRGSLAFLMTRDALPPFALCGSSAVRLRRCFARRPCRSSAAPGPAPSLWSSLLKRTVLALSWARSPAPVHPMGNPRIVGGGAAAALGTLRITFPLPSGRAGTPLEIPRFRDREPRLTRSISAPFHQDFFVTVPLSRMAVKH